MNPCDEEPSCTEYCTPTKLTGNGGTCRVDPNVVYSGDDSDEELPGANGTARENGR